MDAGDILSCRHIRYCCGWLAAAAAAAAVIVVLRKINLLTSETVKNCHMVDDALNKMYAWSIKSCIHLFDFIMRKHCHAHYFTGCCAIKNSLVKHTLLQEFLSNN
uniref:Uncharacterized protein n=1 Tax=Glossina pallidipes TaxID=7398 RepID=A0A1B0A110_GLOPL